METIAGGVRMTVIPGVASIGSGKFRGLGVSQPASCSLGNALVCRSRGRLAARGGSPPAAAAAMISGLGGSSLYSLSGPLLRQQRVLRKITPRSASVDENADITVEEATEELEKQAEESKAVYSEAVDALKEQTIKLQESAKGAYEPTAEKAIEVLRDTTEKLKEEAEKARALLTATAIETAELGKSNLNLLAESGPDPIKDIAETAVNAHLKENTRQGSKIHDFCLGIPYGAIMVVGGFLWFIISGSTDAIRFGVILGGLLLFLSVKSLKVWKDGKSSIPYIQGQAVIALIIFAKDSRAFLKTGAFFPPAVSALASGAILAFYTYVYLSGGNPPKKEKTAEPNSAV
ncbi:unnamed protein product [Calypogeia fissa]